MDSIQRVYPFFMVNKCNRRIIIIHFFTIPYFALILFLQCAVFVIVFSVYSFEGYFFITKFFNCCYKICIKRMEQNAIIIIVDGFYFSIFS